MVVGICTIGDEEPISCVRLQYLLNYIDDASYRRRILVQLNRGEQRHQLARAVFHGRRGQVWKKYQDGQEDQLGALGLVVNMIVFLEYTVQPEST